MIILVGRNGGYCTHTCFRPDVDYLISLSVNTFAVMSLWVRLQIVLFRMID